MLFRQDADIAPCEEARPRVGRLAHKPPRKPAIVSRAHTQLRTYDGKREIDAFAKRARPQPILTLTLMPRYCGASSGRMYTAQRPFSRAREISITSPIAVSSSGLLA